MDYSRHSCINVLNGRDYEINSTQRQIDKSLPWVNDFSLQTVRIIGISELLGAIGVVVPQLTGIYPILSPIAAIGLAIIMVLASAHHLPKKEYKEVGFNSTLLILAVIVALYRF